MTFAEAHRAIKRGDINRIREELENGLEPNLGNQYSWTILMAAAMKGDTQIGRLLIEKGADVERRNKFGQSALSLAAHTGHPSFVQLLLVSGASLNCDPDGKSLEVFLNWTEKYSGNSKEKMDNIRELFERERNLRAQVAGD